MSQDFNPYTCSTLVIFMYWACDNTPSMQSQPRNGNNILSFLQWTPLVARSFCESCICHNLYILVKAPLCCDGKDRAASVQNFPLSHQTTIKIPRRARLFSACSRHMDVVLHAHPVRGESHIHHNANWEAERLQHLQQGWASFLIWLRVKESSKLQT